MFLLQIAFSKYIYFKFWKDNLTDENKSGFLKFHKAFYTREKKQLSI